MKRRIPPHDPWTPQWGRKRSGHNGQSLGERAFRIARIQSKYRFPRLDEGGVLTASSPIHTFASSIPQRRPRPPEAAEGRRSLHLQPRIIRRGGIVSTGFPGLNAPWRGWAGALEGVVEIESGEFRSVFGVVGVAAVCRAGLSTAKTSRSGVVTGAAATGSAVR